MMVDKIKEIARCGVVPVTGNGAFHSIGSDTYGYTIGKVLEDGALFEVVATRGRGESYQVAWAILCTRKNSHYYGEFVEAEYDFNKCKWQAKPGKYKTVYVPTEMKGEYPTYLDPSF